ncbi:hypothetical protein [Dictyobacter kobayashii]|uniref:Uncharacterized protein n=1 Tax=Dictyobacter kobayashii TaxID=2014872 RepID=A0A402AHU6_9CHLR|nr:hypothetical protein [Dictyobacter kobayashii]GCE18690.1 hypothetical protein KDK_24900 [Dictyobacter kobayashii]
MAYTQVQFGDWILEVDVESTKEAYVHRPYINRCRCQGCQNYFKLCSSLPAEILATFNSLGIDPMKEGEVSVLYKNDDGTHVYDGFYTFTGTILKQPIEQSLLPCTNTFSISFTDKISILTPPVLKPMLQINFMATFPWILKESSEY